eukprot:5962693-Pyramimonas_sp.AAC.2
MQLLAPSEGDASPLNGDQHHLMHTVLNTEVVAATLSKMASDPSSTRSTLRGAIEAMAAVLTNKIAASPTPMSQLTLKAKARLDRYLSRSGPMWRGAASSQETQQRVEGVCSSSHRRVVVLLLLTKVASLLRAFRFAAGTTNTHVWCSTTERWCADHDTIYGAVGVYWMYSVLLISWEQ